MYNNVRQKQNPYVGRIKQSDEQHVTDDAGNSEYQADKTKGYSMKQGYCLIQIKWQTMSG